MSKILITGGAGFIGSAVIRHLQQFNNEIFVIDNLSFGNREFISVPDTNFFHEDILNRDRMVKIIGNIKPDYVIHLAAVHFIPYCNEHPYESSNINIRGTMHILEAARLAGVQKVFFASTAAVYPIYDEAVTEQHVVGPLDIYGLSKLTGEHLCNEFHMMTGIPTVICRFFNAFGPNETNPHLIPEIQKQILGGNRKIKLGNLTPKRDFIHTYDMANAVHTLLDKTASGIHTYNLGRGIEYSVTEIVDAFSEAIGEKIEIEVDPARVRKVERMHLLADVTKLKSLGWQPKTGIEDGIRTLVE
ncbi:MAG: NAD-dependent epimerase/dehydratase family protein [Bacteroidia bacterium]|nr:NAD-dependent epimerase/dehydratase family protein [Bacteroidota bacterium]MBP9081484.1 NAD-dependent epimerase/dehydratase family protein [Bacteroidia bacterium]MBK8414797.1 NAD-dependent epimerase/dehydratase family protein [Bacteroidota bacterium]MBK8872935.1 NAD-dependent epimerase/dehydratase family protein [Bacteroidota bacterium]MBK9422956.1 NAD-dependent epimerase/dehydratase family protein [Bacteroidota bacterium]